MLKPETLLRIYTIVCTIILLSLAVLFSVMPRQIPGINPTQVPFSSESTQTPVNLLLMTLL